MLSGDASETVSLVGTTLGSYVLERELGRGGMGAVYVGVDQLIGKRAAIKVLLPEISMNASLVQRFVNEARAATAVRHPGIVEVFQYGVSEDGRAYIVMEYLDGESLAARLKSHGQLPIASALAIARQTATVLAAAHKAGIVHRDLKPDNIFLVPDAEISGGERVKLLDFGVAKLIDQSSQSQTVTGAILGTPQYMSPEQCEGARVVDHRTDLYSLGCTLFQMLTGRLPFVVGGVGGMIGAHLHMTPPHVREHNPTVSDVLDRIIDRLLAKSPDDRFQSADEVATVLADPATGAITRPQPIPETPIASLRPTQRPTGSSPTHADSRAVGRTADHPLARLDADSAVAPTLAPDAPTRDGRPTQQESADAPARKRRGWLLPVVGIALAAGAGATVFVLVRPSGDEPARELPPPPEPANIVTAIAIDAPVEPPKQAAGQSWINLLEIAVDKPDYAEAAKYLAEIAKLDDQRAHDTADAIKAKHHAAAIAAAVPDIDKLRIDHKCDDAKKRAANIADTWGQDDALVKASTPCAKQIATTPTQPNGTKPDGTKPIGDGTLPFPTTRNDPSNPDADKPSDGVTPIVIAYRARAYGRLLLMCKNQAPRDGASIYACMAGACEAGRPTAAFKAFQLPTDANGNAQKARALDYCRKRGVDLEELAKDAREDRPRRRSGR